MLNNDELEMLWIEDMPLKGQWHCGSNSGWMILEHIPTKMSVTVYGKQQHKVHALAKETLEYMLISSTDEKCKFPETFEKTLEEHITRKNNRFLETFMKLEKKGNNQ